MSIAYTAEQILELAPDSSAAKAGRDLATTSKWKNLGQSEQSIWGECQGSGAKPYQTRADLTGPAFKCSCPSRKFPCKHSLALALLCCANATSFEEKEPPAWVSEWLATRGSKKRKDSDVEKSPEQQEESLAAKDKRKQERFSRVQAGIEELELFMSDVMRQGIGAVKKQPFAFWKNRAARLVDAQAPGLARLVSECAEIIARSSDWEDALIDKLATINLICRAFLKLEELSSELKADVLTAIGFNQSQEELLAGAGKCIDDLWLVVGQYSYTQDRLRVQRNWLWGKNSGQLALVLGFAHGTAPFDTMLIPGIFYQGELVFYQGSLPQRALVKSKISEPAVAPIVSGLTSVAAALSSYASDLAKTPWLDTVPFLMQEVIPLKGSDGKWWLVDQEKNGLPLIVKEDTGWQLLSYSGGQALSLFGEWDGTTLKPLAAMKDGNYLRLQFVEV
ncbi:SWIM zinc finger family protein [soil metagenome]